MNITEAPTAQRPSISQRIGARWRRDLVFFLIAATVVLFDQLTKSWVRANLDYGEVWEHEFWIVRIIHVSNSGAAFGILPGATPFLIVMSLFGLGAILLYYVYPPMEHGLIYIALGMQLGGAAGNLIDRVRRGEVTDFVDVGSFPTFNVADSAITISIIAVLAFFLLEETGGGDRNKPAHAAAAGAPDAGPQHASDD